MADRFANNSDSVSDQGRRHFAITPSNSTDIADRPKALYCETAGTVVIRDEAGTDLTYTLVQGQILPFRGVRVLATGTTATVYGWS
jgi:hypothetical protein